MDRVFNFSPGPAMLPETVLKKVQSELLSWNNTGMSVMELPHRGSHFKNLIAEIEKNLRALLSIPDTFEVLFLPGGSRGVFASMPMNFANGYQEASYLVTGHWSKIAMEESRYYLTPHLLTDSSKADFLTVPEPNTWQYKTDSAYLHYVENETIHGIEFSKPIESQGLPLLCDMSSNLLSRPVDFSKFDMVYACAQKNCGPAGITIVIVKKALLERECMPFTPSIFRYAKQAEQDSMLNTPPTFPWYMVGLIVDWVNEQGGLIEMDRLAKRRSTMLYEYIDQSDFYRAPVDPTYRSRMDVRFHLRDESLNDVFVKASTAAGFTNLKGHRVLGGMRAAIYNAMPVEGVEKLLQFMADFERKHA